MPHVWDNFSVDDDPTAFPDPLANTGEATNRWGDADSASYSQTARAGKVRTQSASEGSNASYQLTTRIAPGASTMRRQQSLPSAWRVQADGSHQGHLFRLKGKWKKQWAKELVVVQHNVLLVCTKEQPFLVKHCIPLVNIQKVEAEANDSVKFALTYLAPLKKGRSRVTVMHFRTGNKGERQSWINRLVEFQRKALSRDTPIADFVEKQNVEKTLKSVYANLTATVTLALVGSIIKCLGSAQDRSLRYAFQTWRKRLQSQLKLEINQKSATIQEAVAEQTAELSHKLEEAQHMAKRDRALMLAADRLRSYQRQLLHMSLLRLKRNTDIHTTEAMVAGAASLMTFNWRVQAEELARDATTWRRRRINGIFMLMRHRRLREALEKLRVNSVLCAEGQEKKISLLTSFLIRQEEIGLAEKKVIWSQWRLHMIQLDRRRDALQACVIAEEAWQARAVLRKWFMTVAKRSTFDIVAVSKMETALKLVVQRQMGIAFREIYRHMDEETNLQSLQVASNLSLLNSKLVKSFNQMPLHRAVIILSSVWSNMRRSRLKISFMCLRAHAIRMVYLEKSAEAFSTMWYSLQKRRFLYQSFYKLHRFSSHKFVRDSTRSNRLHSLALVLKLKRVESLNSAFHTWRRTAFRNSLEIEKKEFLHKYRKVVAQGSFTSMQLLSQRILGWHERIVQRRLAWGLRGLECNCEKSMMLRSVLRLQVTQRVVQLFDRLRIVKVASAFEAFKLLLAPSIQARMDEKLITETVGASENLCSRIERRRLRQKIFGLGSVTEDFDEIYPPTPPVECLEFVKGGSRRQARRREKSPLKLRVRARLEPTIVSPQKSQHTIRLQPYESTQWAPSDQGPRPLCQAPLLPSLFPVEPASLQDLVNSPARLPSIDKTTQQIFARADSYLEADSPIYPDPHENRVLSPATDLPASPFVESYATPTPARLSPTISFSESSVDLEELDDILGQLSVVTVDSRAQQRPRIKSPKIEDWIDWHRIVDYIEGEYKGDFASIPSDLCSLVGASYEKRNFVGV